MKQAVIYARYSSDKQTEDSIEAQLRACRDYAAVNGLYIIDTYIDEAISGSGAKTASRAQYQRMLRDCKKGIFDMILIHKYDRIARNLGEHVNLEKRLSDLDIQLIATAQDFGTSKEAKIMKSLVWAMSEYYLDNLSEEVQKGHKETALKALHNGGYPPFGYDVVNQHYVINEIEAMYVKKIFQAAFERQGFTDIIREMELSGIRGKRGKVIRYPQIYEMLRNEKYTGVYAYSPKEERRRIDRRDKPNAIRIENALPIIIDKAHFLEVQKIMAEKKQTGKKAGYLCSGLVYCECGAKMHGMKSKRKGHEYEYFYCSARCGAPVVHMEDVDKAALKYLRELLSKENQIKIADAMRNYKGNEAERVKDFNTILKRKIKEKQDQYDSLLSNMASGALPPAVLEDIGNKLQELKTQIETLKNTTPPKDYTTEQVQAWLESIKAAPDREAIHLLIERIDVEKDKEKTVFNIQSTLNTVLGNIGCGRRI